LQKILSGPTEESFLGEEVTGPIFAAGHALALLDVKEKVSDYEATFDARGSH
jgi:hypothetical protein